MKSGFSEAPPTKKPSISGFFARSAAFSAVTDPENSNENEKDLQNHHYAEQIIIITSV